MFDFVHRRKRVVQLILALITLPFAFFGVDYYFRSGPGVTEVARVGSDKITQADFDVTLREQQDRMRQQLGRNYDPAVLDNPEVRYSLLEQLIGQRLLDDQSRRGNFRVSDDQLRQFIGDIAAFQIDGKFSQQRYEQVLATQNPPKTSAQFINEVRQALTLAPLQEPISAGNIVAKSNVERYLSLLEQQREVAVAVIAPDAFVKEAKVNDDAVKAFYDANLAMFQIPEQVKIEYVTLTPDAFAKDVTLDPADVKKQYDDNLKQFAKAEERQASHILIAVKPDASAADKAAAKAKADALLVQLRKNPAQFAELAKQNSQDPGSAAQGGDLGTFARDGSMVKPFEDAVFTAKQGDIVGPVATDFGWHIIKVTGVKTAKTQSFDEAKPAIEADLKRQKSAKKFADSADQFQNLVYENADSLQPVAKALNLQVQMLPMQTRAQVLALGQGNPKFAQSVFSPDSLTAKRNTEAIEVAPNTLMAARVVEYQAATPRPFDEIKADIRRSLETKAASELAQAAGKEKLAALQAKKDVPISFGKPVTLARNQPQPGFTQDALVRIFQADPAKLPAYVGATGEGGGYAIYKVQQVHAAPAPDAARLAGVSGRMGEQLGREMFNAYVASLKAKADVKINQVNLEKKTAPP
ncbi:MAG: SurA N-terminal domain-containing protein [Casimicrobiaceae bacterium]